MYLVPDLLEEIFLQLPLKSILRFKTVSKQWRSILESRRFAERRRANNVKKIPQILAVRDHRTDSRFQGDEEVEMVYLQSEAAATRASLTCDGLVCIPVPGWVNVLNPCTGECYSKEEDVADVEDCWKLIGGWSKNDTESVDWPISNEETLTVDLTEKQIRSTFSI